MAAKFPDSSGSSAVPSFDFERKERELKLSPDVNPPPAEEILHGMISHSRDSSPVIPRRATPPIPEDEEKRTKLKKGFEKMPVQVKNVKEVKTGSIISTSRKRRDKSKEVDIERVPVNREDQESKIKQKARELIARDIDPSEREFYTTKITAFIDTNYDEKILEDKGKEKLSLMAEDRILYRGCKPDQLAEMLVFDSAGGKGANPKTGKPSERKSVDQVAEKERLPEFSSSPSIAQRFSTGTLIIQCRIKKEYLYQGSNTEIGLVTNHDAPIEILKWGLGRGFVK